MAYLGIDFGTTNIGIAVSEMGIAIPYAVWAAGDFYTRLPDVLQSKNIDTIIVGVAIGYDPYGKQYKTFQAFIAKLQGFVGADISVIEQDEDLSTFEAQAALNSYGNKDHLDDVAASIILQRYLDDSN